MMTLELTTLDLHQLQAGLVKLHRDLESTPRPANDPAHPPVGACDCLMARLYKRVARAHQDSVGG